MKMWHKFHTIFSGNALNRTSDEALFVIMLCNHGKGA